MFARFSSYKRCYKWFLPTCGFTLWLFFTAAHAQTPESAASLRGIVTNASGGGGLRKAYLRLSPVIGSNGGASFTAVTNDQGTFAIENIAPGEYRLDAECVGFLDTQYGGGSPIRGVSIRLSGGDKLTGVEITMKPQAILSGRVLDQDGEPWPHANIQVLHAVWKKGKRSLDADSGVQGVDDRGEFRVAGLSPGLYYVRAEPDQDWERNHRPADMRQHPTWYPSSPDAESSTPVVLDAGQRSPEIEIRLRSGGAGSTFRIRGRASRMQDVAMLRGDPRWVQRRIEAKRISEGPEVEQNLSLRLSPDGSFEIAGVSSGTYNVWISQGYPSVPLGHAQVQIDDRDVEGVSIELHAPQTLRVNLRIEGGEETESPGNSMYLEPIGFFGYFGELEPTAKHDGGLEFQEVGVGRYRVDLTDSARARFYLKSVRYENADCGDRSFTFTPDGGPLEVILSARGAQIVGTLTRESAAQPRVVLIPDTSDAAQREYLERTGDFDQNGVFTIKAVAPGSYKLYAFESVPEDVWLVPDFLKEIESFGVALKAAEGDLTTIQLPLLGKAETDRILARLDIEN